MGSKKTLTIDDIDHDDIEVVSTPDNIEFNAPVASQADIQKIIEDPVKALAVGLTQGATLGFGDEMAAGVDAQFNDKPYEQIRDDIRSRQSKLEEEHPVASMLGQGIGGLAVPVGPLARMAQPIAEGVTGIPALSQALINLGLKSAQGATDASLYTLGRTNKDVMHGDIPTDEITTNMKIGAGVPLTLGALGNLGQLAIKGAKKIPGTNEMVESFNEGRKGYQVFNKDKTELRTMLRMKQMAEQVSDKIGEEGEKLPAMLNKATEQGKNVNLNYIDEALNSIDELASKRSTPEQQRKELFKLRDQLLDFRQGREIETTIPSSTQVIPGDKNISGEEETLRQLQNKAALLRAADEAGQPEAMAKNKLAERQAKSNILDENVTGKIDNPILHTEGRIDPSTDIGALQAFDIKTMKPKDIQLIKNASPGEIQSIDIEGKKVMGMMLPNGKFYGKTVLEVPINREGSVIGPEAESTNVKFKTTPEQTIMQRQGGGETASPKDVYDFRKQLRNVMYVKEGVEYPETKQLINDLMNKSDEELETIVPGFKNQMGNVATLKSALESASLVAAGKTKSQQVEGMGKKLFREAAKTTGEGAGAAEAKFDMRQFFKSLKQVDPEMASEIEPKFTEQVKRYGLSTGVKESPLQTTTPRGLIGSLTSLTSRASGYSGYKTGQLDRFVKRIGEKFGYGKSTEGLINKLNKLVYDKDLSQQAKNAIIFSIAQDPAHREMLRGIESNVEESPEE